MKIFSTALLCLCSCCAFAQLQKGAMLVEGIVNFEHRKNEEDQPHYPVKTTSNYIRIDPKWGIMLNKHWMLGTAFLLQNSEYKNTINTPDLVTTVKTKTRTLGGGPFIRRFFSITEKLYLHADLITRYEVSTNKGQTPEDDFDARGIQLSLRGGVTYFINTRWGITSSFGSLYYNQSKTDFENRPSQKQSGFGASLQANTFSIGFQYFLRNKIQSE